ncbi:MAG: transcription termination factor NusA [Candidatus Dojkabacteria bacterium]
MAAISEFVTAINQICSERGIDAERVYKALEEAVLAAFLKETQKMGDFIVEMDRETGKFRVIQRKLVVKKVENPETEIALKEAQKINKNFEEGDTIETEQEFESFGRIAAQTAKQVIMQSIRDAEHEAVLAEYSGKTGEVFTALMQRMQNGKAVFEIGKATAFMPQEEQVSNEFYRVGDRYKVYLKSIEDDGKGETLIVSRAAPEFLIKLFEMEVPEIESGIVEIKAVAREAGSRSKIAVVSHQEGVDPIGSCVGQKGTRIANVMSELGEEKIDIIEWKEELADFVEKALSPAQVISVKVDKEGLATVKVEEDQLSLAIGREGQNVRLAAKLTETRIDIQGPKGPLQSKKDDNATDDKATDDNASDDNKSDDSTDVVDTTENVEMEVKESVVDASETSKVETTEEVKEVKAVKASKAKSAKKETKAKKTPAKKAAKKSK